MEEPRGEIPTMKRRRKQLSITTALFLLLFFQFLFLSRMPLPLRLSFCLVDLFVTYKNVREIVNINRQLRKLH